jgi:hypothetical protein
MRLNLSSLQKVVEKTIVEERATEAFKAELSRVFGPTVITEGQLNVVAASANDWLDVLDRTGRSGRLEFRPTVTAAFLDHNDPEVRRFAVRVCPEQYLARMTSDKNPAVRHAVAGRMTLNAIREMIKRFPKDDQLRSIFRQKKALHEAGVKQPSVEPMGHDPVDGAERMGDVTRTQLGPELSEGWYEQHAMRLMHDYGQNIEYAWEELAVRRFCSSMKATNGVEIDEAKLLKSVKKLIEDKEDRAMERSALKETLEWLDSQVEAEDLNEGLLPEYVEEVDPVQTLVEAGLTNEQFVEEASKLFKIQQSLLPLGIRKHRLGEGNARQMLVPCIGTLPAKGGFRAVDERALDMFCEAWSKRQAIQGEPLRLEWVNHPTDINKVGFTCILK